MDQQPHPYPQTSHIPCLPNNYYPNWENPQLKPDLIKSPATHGPWSYGGGFGYPNSMESHGCCNHMYHSPSYYTVRPPLHPHLPMPSPFYYHGPYPPYAEGYPPYHAPHLYPMQQPGYEYGRHCCGCPNHVSDKKEEKGVKIEEFEPEIGKKDSDSLGQAKGGNNWLYPFLLVPPDYLKKNGDLKSLEIDPKLLNGCYSFGMKNDSESGKPSESESKNRLFLPEVKDVKSIHPVVDDKATQKSSMEDRRAQFPFPFLWSPNYAKLEDQKNKDGEEIDANTSPKLMEEQPDKLKIIPLNYSGTDNHVTTPVEDKCGNKGNEKKAEKNVVKVRNIPVQQIEDRGEKNVAESKSTFKEVHVEQKREYEKKSSGNDENTQSSSPRKASKLPPVCLRVDPLPRRKTAKGTSKSPSPPGGKTQVNQNTSNCMQLPVESKECPSQAEQVCLQKKSEEEKPRHHMRADHSGDTLDHCEEISRNYDEPHSKITVADISNKEASLISSLDERDLCKRENESVGDGETVTVVEIMAKGKQKELSTMEAALLIQSYYRGFEVRKWKPLEKLKLIAKVREQANAVREQISVLESSSEVQKDEKRRVLISETIMSLLLQLDTIQGLHPSVREIRKALARELVSMQEKLDSLVNELRREENNPEPTNTSSASLLDAGCEAELQNGCLSEEPTDQPKEAEDPCPDENQLSADRGLEESIVAPSDSKFETVSQSIRTKDERLNLKDRGVGEKFDGTLALHAERAETPMMKDKKEDSEMEELPELLTQKEFCESEGNWLIDDESLALHAEFAKSPMRTDKKEDSEMEVLSELLTQKEFCEREGNQSIDVDDSPSFTEENEAILLGKDKDSITHDDVYVKSSLDDCTSQSTVDGSAPLDTKDKELGLGKDGDDILGLTSQGQPTVCASAVNEEVAVKDHVRGGADDKMLKEENEKLREMIDKLIREGRQQLTVISDLDGKVKNLERRLTKKKRMRRRAPNIAKKV